MDEVESAEKLCKEINALTEELRKIPSAAPDCYAIGDKVRLLKDIWEGEIDGLIPPGYLAMKGEILVVRRFGGLGKSSLGISHENRPDDYFIVLMDEIERA